MRKITEIKFRLHRFIINSSELLGIVKFGMGIVAAKRSFAY